MSPNDGPLPDAGGSRAIAKNGHTCDAGRDLFKQFRPFSTQTLLEMDKASGVAARPGQASDVAVADWINGLREHDRYGASCLEQWCCRPPNTGQDRVR